METIHVSSIYRRGATALLLVDPYNDFLSEGGKVWPRIQAIAEEVGLLANLKAIVQAARAGGLRVCIAPHRRWEPGDYRDWLHPNPTQIGIMKRHSFARGEWGGEWHPDFAPSPATSSPKNIGDKVVSPTRISTSSSGGTASRRSSSSVCSRIPASKSTARYTMELGYHVTLVRDATAAFTREMMHAAHELNGPTFAHAILTTAQLIAALPTSEPTGSGADADQRSDLASEAAR